MYKLLALVAPVLAGTYYFASGTEYDRIVDRRPEAVAAALADLDITDQPGSPGSSAEMSGGVMPIFKHRRTASGVEWTVMSGEKVAIVMTAHLTPIDGGKRTRVTASVDRGDAPDDFVSPAFRSESLAMALFGMAIEDELNDLVAVANANPADCVKLFDRFAASNAGSADLQDKTSLTDAIGDAGKVALKLHAFDAEARRMGCDRFRERFGENFDVSELRAENEAESMGADGLTESELE